MALFSPARHAFRRSLAAAPPRDASLGAGLLRLFMSSNASIETSRATDKNLPPSGSEVAADLEMEYKRRLEEKRRELIESLVQAVDTCEPAQRVRVMEKYKVAERAFQEYRAERQKNPDSNNGSQRSKTTADLEKSKNFWKHLSITTGSILLGITLADLESKWRV